MKLPSVSQNYANFQNPFFPPKIQNPKRFWSQAFWIKDTQNAICTDIDYHVNSIGTFKSKRFVEMASLMTPTTVSAT